MSTDPLDQTPLEEYVPSDPPTKKDWDYLSSRADRNKRRGRRATIISCVAAALAVILLISGGLIYLAQKDVPNLTQKTNDILVAQQKIIGDQQTQLASLRKAEDQREADSKLNAVAFAVILENFAAGFATPPPPDPDRLKAVQGFCDTAAQFRAAVDAPPHAQCP